MFSEVAPTWLVSGTPGRYCFRPQVNLLKMRVLVVEDRPLGGMVPLLMRDLMDDWFADTVEYDEKALPWQLEQLDEKKPPA